MYDICIIGGGIIGFSSALEFQKKSPKLRILVLDKEKGPGLHQTKHNSGVIHSGIYYSPGSMKAKLCREGLESTKHYCNIRGIPFVECGKLIVATNSLELERIDALYDRANANGLFLERLGKQSLKLREPNIRGIAALFSPKTAIVDFYQVCRNMAEEFLSKGGAICYETHITRINETDICVEIASGDEVYKCKRLVVCAGVQSDRLARLAGLDINYRIVPFRGEYFQLPSDKNKIVNHLIYPAPDPTMPFLGIHLTRMINGSVTVGPNAVIGFAREGYRKFSFSFVDTLDFTLYSGFWRLIGKHWRHAVNELSCSLLKTRYLKECQKYCPSLTLNDLQPYRAGIRAQAVSVKGEAIHDFLFEQTERMLHVCNAPSPAATSAIPIGRMIANKVLG